MVQQYLNHMHEINETTDFVDGYYLPHHEIFRLSIITTKLRVVFNASSKTTNGKSLNDLICKVGYFEITSFLY